MTKPDDKESITISLQWNLYSELILESTSDISKDMDPSRAKIICFLPFYKGLCLKGKPCLQMSATVCACLNSLKLS